LYVWGRLKIVEKGELRGKVSENKNLENIIKWQKKNPTCSPFTFQRIITVLLFFGSALTAVLAMLTKEISFTLPLMILLYELSFFPASRIRKIIISWITASGATLGLVFLTVTDLPLEGVFDKIDSLLRENLHISRSNYLLTQFRVVVIYLRLLFLPINQNLDYNLGISKTIFTPPVFLSFLLLLGIMVLALWLYLKTSTVKRKSLSAGRESKNKKLKSKAKFKQPVIDSQPSILDLRVLDPAYRLIGFGILWFFLTLSVESSFIPIADVMAEHRLYLPSVGIVLAVSVSVALMKRTSSYRWKIALLTALVLSLSIATVRRNQVWSDPVTLWSDVVSKSPMNERAWCNLGVAQYEKGDTQAALSSLIESEKINPNYAKTQVNLGVLFAKLGQLSEAISTLEKALKINPKIWSAHSNLGAIYIRIGQIDPAIEHFEAALRLNPRNTSIQLQLDQVRHYKTRHPTSKPEPTKVQ